MKRLVSAAGFVTLCALCAPLGFSYAGRCSMDEAMALLLLPIAAIWPATLWHFLIGRNLIYAYFEAGERFEREALQTPSKPALMLPAPSEKTMPILVKGLSRKVALVRSRTLPRSG